MTHVVCDSIGLVACVHLVPRRKLGSAKLAACSQQRLLLTVAESVNKSTSNLFLIFIFSFPNLAEYRSWLPGGLVLLKMKNFMKMIKNEAHFTSVLHDFSEAFVTGKFCDVKVVCKVKYYSTHNI